MSQQVGALKPDEERPIPSERRAYVRYLRLREARVHTGTTPTRIFGVALIREVSVNGLRLFLSTHIKEGTILSVEPRGINFPRPLLARVVHAAQQASGWIHGCELANNLNDEELQLLMS